MGGRDFQYGMNTSQERGNSIRNTVNDTVTAVSMLVVNSIMDNLVQSLSCTPEM